MRSPLVPAATVVLAMGLAFLAQGCAGEATAPDDSPSTATAEVKKESIRIAMRDELPYAPLFIAQDEGYFDAEGLDVEMVPMRAAESVMNLTLGEVDVFTGMATVGMLNAIHRGERLRIVAGKGLVDDRCAAYAFVARPELIDAGRLDDWSDLRGMRLWWVPSTIFEYATKKLLDKAGLTFADVVRADVPSGGGVAAFERDELDVRLWTEPAFSILEREGTARVWRSVNDVAPGMQVGTVVFGPRLLDEQPELGVRFLKAYLRAVRQYNEGHTDRNVEILQKHMSLDRELIRNACWATIHDDGSANLESIADFAEWAHQRGYVEASVPIEDIWLETPLRKARQSMAAESPE